MGNSTVWRIHTTDDLDDAFAMAQRLFAQRLADNCPQDVSAQVDLDSHAGLDRFLAVGDCWLSATVPVEHTEQMHAVLCPLLPDGDRPRRRSDQPWSLGTRLTEPVVAALLQLPPVKAEIYVPEVAVPSDLPERVIALIGTEQASISWDVCWPGQHDRCGFELTSNGLELWHPDTPPGHSVYVHVGAHDHELLHTLAAAVGGQVVGPPATGW